MANMYYTGFYQCSAEGSSDKIGFCDFVQETSDQFDWSRRAGSTPTADTGPVTDHTFNDKSGREGSSHLSF